MVVPLALAMAAAVALELQIKRGGAIGGQNWEVRLADVLLKLCVCECRGCGCGLAGYLVFIWYFLSFFFWLLLVLCE